MPDLISSVSNPRVKQLVALRDRRDREAAGVIVVEGIEELRVALSSGAVLQTLFDCPQRLPATHLARNVRQQAIAAAAEHVELAPAPFEKAAYRDDPSGLLGVFKAPSHDLDRLKTVRDPLLLVMEGVEKPGNIGAMLRTADAAGVDAVLICAAAGQPMADLGNPNLIRSSKGSCFTLPVGVADNDAVLTWLKQRQVRVLAATPDGAQPFTSASMLGPLALVVGEEARGLSPFWLQHADARVLIPMHGRVNSLNVSVSAAVLLYEAERQRHGN